MRKIFFDNLPKRKSGQILWNKSIGQDLHFIYEEIEGLIKIVNYNTNGKYNIVLQYNDNIKSLTSDDLLKVRIARLINYKKQHKYLYNINDTIKDNNRDLKIIGYKNKRVNRKDGKTELVYGYDISCNICGWDNGWIAEKILKQGCGCPCCASKIVVPGINDIATTVPWMIQYFQDDDKEITKKYTKCSNYKIYPICPYCHKVSKKKYSISDIYSNNGFLCSCSDSLSRLSKYMRSLLDQLIIEKQIDFYDTEVKFDWCTYFNIYKNKQCYGIFDFVIESKKLIIETDGGFHRTNNSMSGQTKEESIFIDMEKDKCAKQNGYIVVRISDEFDIKQSIINNFDGIFDLKNISWSKCEKNSLRNYQAEAMKLKNDHPEYTTSDISKILKLGETTIRRWLNLGANAEICLYNAEQERKRAVFHKGDIPENIKSIICLNNGIKFKSGAELSKKSKELFGQYFSRSVISTCCNRKVQDIKGYIFRFENDLTDTDNKILLKNTNKEKLKSINNKILKTFDKFIEQNPDVDIELYNLFLERKKCIGA